MQKSKDDLIHELRDISIHLLQHGENLRSALKLTAEMYERATGFPMPSQAWKALQDAGL